LNGIAVLEAKLPCATSELGTISQSYECNMGSCRISDEQIGITTPPMSYHLQQ
jgi:hypothetical protein